jgi:hypothetical protein
MKFAAESGMSINALTAVKRTSPPLGHIAYSRNDNRTAAEGVAGRSGETDRQRVQPPMVTSDALELADDEEARQRAIASAAGGDPAPEAHSWRVVVGRFQEDA